MKGFTLAGIIFTVKLFPGGTLRRLDAVAAAAGSGRRARATGAR
jgi:hypothetical protein